MRLTSTQDMLRAWPLTSSRIILVRPKHCSVWDYSLIHLSGFHFQGPHTMLQHHSNICFMEAFVLNEYGPVCVRVHIPQTPAPDPFEGRRPVPDCKSTSMSEFCLLIIVMAQLFISLPQKKLLLPMLWHLQLPKSWYLRKHFNHIQLDDSDPVFFLLKKLCRMNLNGLIVFTREIGRSYRINRWLKLYSTWPGLAVSHTINTPITTELSGDVVTAFRCYLMSLVPAIAEEVASS